MQTPQHVPLFDVQQAFTNTIKLRAISISGTVLAVAITLGALTAEKPWQRWLLLGSALGICQISRLASDGRTTQDRILQDYRDISDASRQQMLFQGMTATTALPKPVEIEAEPVTTATAKPHNLPKVIASKLKSTVLLGAPRAGKGYALAKGIELLPDNVDLWLIDPKDDPSESHYWQRVKQDQRVRFDVTSLDAAEVDKVVMGLLKRFLQASSSADRPKLLIVDECAPGLASGMSAKAYKTMMGRLSTICSVGPSKGNFVFILAQATDVESLKMSNANKASFRLVAVGNAGVTEESWFRSLRSSMGFPMPDENLKGYIQLVNNVWAPAEPFSLTSPAKESTGNTALLAEFDNRLDEIDEPLVFEVEAADDDEGGDRTMATDSNQGASITITDSVTIDPNTAAYLYRTIKGLREQGVSKSVIMKQHLGLKGRRYSAEAVPMWAKLEELYGPFDS